MIKLVFCLRRLPNLSREEFQRYWLDTHGPLVRELAPALAINSTLYIVLGFGLANALAAMLKTLYTLSKPTIARVHGAAYGGGAGLVACCDIAFAAHDATFSLSEAKLGLIPATISPYVLARIGEGRARGGGEGGEGGQGGQGGDGAEESGHGGRAPGRGG